MNRAYRTREFCGAKLGKENEVFRPDGKLLYVERSLKNGTAELTEYIWAGSTLWAEKRTTESTAGTESAVYYHHTDYHGSTEAITDEEKVVVWKASYDAYGNVLEATGEMEFEASFTGKMFDKDSGLYYFNARWYDSELGRFTTPDPARDGTNWLVYCAANPVGRWDPSGLTVLDDYAYQQRTNSQHGSEEYENSFKIEEEAARRNQGVSTEVATPQSTWNETIEPIITSTFWEVTTGIFNCDFGVDSFKKAGYAWNNGQYIKALLDSTNGIGEAVLDCLFMYQAAATYGPWIEAAVNNLLNQTERGNEYCLYGPMNKGPLPDSIANTFRSGTYRKVTTSSEQILYRVYGGNAGKFGSFWTKEEPLGFLQAQIDLALKPEWGNTASNVVRIKVPVGYTYYEGFAAEQGGYLLGGSNQVYMQYIDPKWEY